VTRPAGSARSAVAKNQFASIDKNLPVLNIPDNLARLIYFLHYERVRIMVKQSQVIMHNNNQHKHVFELATTIQQASSTVTEMTS
jgi:hypothetical protein